MKSILLLSIAVATAFAFASCADQETTATTSKPASEQESYPLTTCVVSGKKLGSMGDPHVIEHEGTTVKFCCDQCVPTFNKDPEKYIAKIKAAKPE